MKQALFVSIRRFASTTLTSLLSFLVIVSPLFGKLSSRARAQDTGGDASGDSFAFSDQSNSIAEAEATDAANNAVKGRSAPVSASGAFTNAVDIALPPGRNGFAPSLALTYDSEAFRTDSPVGTGWSFGVASISRDTSNGFPKQVQSGDDLRYDNRGPFTGPAGPMVRYDEDEGLATNRDSVVYVPVREYEPVRFEYIPEQSRWVEHLPSGVKRYYGQAWGMDGLRRGRVVNELGTHTWLLLKERDTDGNTIEYDYFDLDDPEFGQDRASMTHVQAAPVLRRVSWGGSEYNSYRRPHIYHVLMDPEDYDTGPINMLAGHIQLRKTIERIVVAGPNVSGEPGNEAYWEYRLDLTPSDDTGRLLLRSVMYAAEGVDSIVHSFEYSANPSAKPGIEPQHASACQAARDASWDKRVPIDESAPDLYRTGFSLWLPPGADIWETDIKRSLTPRHHAIGYKFTDLNADGLVDVVYHPQGGGAPNPQILPDKSYIQTDTGWVRASEVDMEQPQGGLYNLPERMFVSALADIDGDVDPDAIGFATYMTPPKVVRDYSHLKPNRSSARPHYFVDGLGWTPPADVAERLMREGLIDPDDLDVPGPWIEEYLNDKAAGMVDRKTQAIHAPPGCVPIFRPVRDVGNSWDDDQPQIDVDDDENGGADGDGDADLQLQQQLQQAIGAARRSMYYVDNGGPTLLSTFVDTVVPEGWNGITWEDIPPWEQAIIDALRPPSAYVCLNADNEAFTLTGSHTERIYVAKNSARRAPGEPAQLPRAVAIEKWPDGVGKRLQLFNQSVPDWETVPAVDGSGTPLYGLKSRTLYRVEKDFSAPMADLNGDGKADLVLLKTIEPRTTRDEGYPRRNGSHYRGVNFIPRAYLSNGETFVLDWGSSEVAPFEADVTNLVDPTWTIEANNGSQLVDVVLPALGGLQAGTQTLPLSVSHVLRQDEIDLAQSVLASYRPGDHLDPALQHQFVHELTNVVEETYFARHPRAEVSLRDVLHNYDLQRQAMEEAGLPSEMVPGLAVDIDVVPDVQVDISGIMRSAHGRVSVGLADVIAAYQQQQTQPLRADRPIPVYPTRPIPVDPDDFEQLQGGLTDARSNAIEAIKAGTTLPPGEVEPLEEVYPVDVTALVDGTLASDAASHNTAPQNPWQPTSIGNDLNTDARLREALKLGKQDGFTSTAIDILADTKRWSCDAGPSDGAQTGFAREYCHVQTTYPTTINYNSVLLDLNADGLSDLVVGRRPMYNNNPRDPAVVCSAGHAVHLNRGYRWDLHEEQLSHATAFEYWSSPTDAQYLGDTQGVLEPIDFPFEKLQNHHGHCGMLGGVDFQFVDFAKFMNTDTGQEMRDWASLSKEERQERAKSVDNAFPSLLTDALASERHDTLPMSAANFVDLNADGRVDIVFAVARSDGSRRADHLEQAAYLNTGRGFQKESGYAARDSGLPSGDFLGSPDDPGPEKSCLLPEDMFFTNWNMAKRETIGESDLSRLVDVNNDGLVDVVYRGVCRGTDTFVGCSEPATWRRNLRKVPDLLTSVERSDGSWARVHYIAGTSLEARNGAPDGLLDPETGERKTRAVVTDVGHLPTGQMLVKEVYLGAGRGDGAWAGLGAQAAEAIEFTYDNFVRQTGKARAVGFEKVKTTHYNSGECQWFDGFVGTEFCDWTEALTTETTFDVQPQVQGSPVPHPLRGHVRTSSTTDVGWLPTTVSSASEFVLMPLGNRAVRIRRRLDLSATSVGSATIESAVEYEDYDDLGYPRRVRSGRWDGSSVEQGHKETTTSESTYHHVRQRWWLGREASSSVHGYSQTIDGNPVPDALLSRSSATFDGNDRVRTTSVLLDEGSDCTAGDEQWSNTTLEYDDMGLVDSIDTNGRRVQMAYGPLELFVARRWTTVPKSEWTNGATLAETMEYDPRFGSVVFAEDPNGITRRATFDAQGRQLTVRGPGDVLLATSLYQDTPGNPSQVITTTNTDTNSSTTAYSAMDAHGRILFAMSLSGAHDVVRTSYNMYDGFGQARASYLPRKAVHFGDYKIQPGELATLTNYDGFGRVTWQVLPDGERTITSVYEIEDWYGGPHHAVTTRDPRGNYAVRYYDTRDQLSFVARTTGGTNLQNMRAAFMYTRDGAGRIVEVLDSDGATRNLTYHVGGGLSEVNLPHQGQPGEAHSYCYDDFGALETATTIGERTATIHRDILGRTEQTVTNYRGDEAVTNFFYDCGAEDNSLGRLCGLSTDTVTTTYGYDEFGRNASFTTTLDPEVAEDLANEFSGVLEFGLAGQLKTATYTGLGNSDDEHVIHMGHDGRGRTTSIAVQTPSESRELVDDAAYDPMGRIERVELSNGVTVDRSFHWATGFFTGATFRRGSAEFAAIEYPIEAYDANGNPGQERRIGTNGRVLSFKTHTFDDLDRVRTSKLTMDNQVRASETFHYSTAGNIDSVDTLDGAQGYIYGEDTNYQAVTTIDLPGGGTRTLDYDPDGWLSSDITLTEDDDGQPFVDERFLEYDAAGCLRKVTVTRGIEGSPGATHTTRNTCGLGSERLVRESTDPYGHTQRTYYLPGNVELRLGEGDDDSGLMMFRLPVSDVTVAQLAWNLRDGDIVEEDSGYVHTDLRGSVLARTSLEDSAATNYVREAEYGAWGKTFEYDDVEAPRYGYTGEEADPGTGYHYFGARVYDPTLRRWLSPDPLVTGVPAVDEDLGNELNLYAYAANNPVALTDPSGMLTDMGLKSDQLTETAIANLEGTSRRAFAVGGAAAIFGGALLTIKGSTAALAVPAVLALETAADWVSAGINAFNALTASTPAEAIQSTAAAGIAVADAMSGPNPAGDIAAAQGTNKLLRKMGPKPSKAQGARPTTATPPKVRSKAPISGTAQKTMKGGAETTHASTSQRIAEQRAAEPTASSVHLNQQVKTIIGGSSRVRPDVATVRKDGKVDVDEVLSPGQTRQQMEKKIKNAFGKRLGKLRIHDPD